MSIWGGYGIFAAVCEMGLTDRRPGGNIVIGKPPRTSRDRPRRPRWGEPRRLPQNISAMALRDYPPNATSRLFTADGSLLFLITPVVEFQRKRDDARDRAHNSNHGNKSRNDMYHLPRKILQRKFPARAIQTPPFRSRGMSGNRLFNLHRINTDVVAGPLGVA